MNYILRLYVAGSTPQSSRAITNIKAICETHLKDRYDLTVVDLYEQQERARDDQIVVAPTLVPAFAFAGAPDDRRFVANRAVLAALDMPSGAESR